MEISDRRKRAISQHRSWNRRGSLFQLSCCSSWLHRKELTVRGIVSLTRVSIQRVPTSDRSDGKRRSLEIAHVVGNADQTRLLAEEVLA